MPKKLTTTQFIKNSVNKHGDKYDYSKVDYKRWDKKVIIICLLNNHGEFYQRPNTHVNGGGCPKCAKINRPDSYKKFI